MLNSSISCLYCQYIGYFILRHLPPCLLGLCLQPTIVFIQDMSHHLQQHWKAIKQSFQLLVNTKSVTYNNHIISSSKEKNQCRITYFFKLLIKPDFIFGALNMLVFTGKTLLFMHLYDWTACVFLLKLYSNHFSTSNSTCMFPVILKSPSIWPVFT